jgi:hypothetical protein
MVAQRATPDGGSPASIENSDFLAVTAADSTPASGAGKTPARPAA